MVHKDEAGSGAQGAGGACPGGAGSTRHRGVRLRTPYRLVDGGRQTHGCRLDGIRVRSCADAGGSRSRRAGSAPTWTLP